MNQQTAIETHTKALSKEKMCLGLSPGHNVLLPFNLMHMEKMCLYVLVYFFNYLYMHLKMSEVFSKCCSH